MNDENAANVSSSPPTRMPDERPVAHQGQVEHRVARTHLDADEDGQQHGRGDQRSPRPDRGPAVLVGPDQAVCGRGRGRRERRDAQHVDPALDRLVGVAQDEQAQPDGQGADGQIDEEDPAPRQAFGQHPAEDRADRGRGPGHRPPHPVRGAPVASGVGTVEQRERRREHRGRADALHRAGRDQRAGVGGDTADEGRRREQGQAGDVDPPVPDEVGDRPGAEHESGQDQRVRVDDPLQRPERRLEVLGHVGEGDVDDRHVDQQHERAEAHGDQRQPLAHVISQSCGVAFSLDRNSDA